MTDLLAQNTEKLKAILNESESRKKDGGGKPKGGAGGCVLVDPGKEKELLEKVLTFSQDKRSTTDTVVQDLERFLRIVSHCNIPCPWTSPIDQLNQCGWFPPTDNSNFRRPGATRTKWSELEQIFKERLLEKLTRIAKESTNQRVIGRKYADVLGYLSLFVDGESILSEYTNARVDGLRSLFIDWIKTTANDQDDAKTETTTRLLESVFEAEFRFGASGVFMKSTSPFQLLHSVCMSPLLEEFVVAERTDGRESLNLYYGFARLSKVADDLHERLAPVVDLFDASTAGQNSTAVEALIGEQSKPGEAPQEVVAPKSRGALDCMSMSNLSAGTTFEPQWTDRMYLLVKPPWLWSHHFIVKLSTITQYCSEIIDRIIDFLAQLGDESSTVSIETRTVVLNGIEYQVFETFVDFVPVSKSIAIVNNRHLILDVGEEIRTLERALHNLTSAIETTADRFPGALSRRNYDLLWTSIRLCRACLEQRLIETWPIKNGLSKNCRLLIDRFAHAHQLIDRLSMTARYGWLRDYLLFDSNRGSDYSDVKPCQEDHISPTYIVWYWHLRCEASWRIRDENTPTIAELLEHTLGQIVARIARTRVSEARQGQLWRDIWFVLRSTVELLMYCDDFPWIFIADDHDEEINRSIRSIAGQCQKFLVVALVMCSPWDRLYPFIKKGHASLIESIGRTKKRRSIWAMVRPDIFLDSFPSSENSLVHFLLKLFSISIPHTDRRRFLTLLIVHIKRNESAVRLWRRMCSKNEEHGSMVVEEAKTGLLWILTYGSSTRTDGNELAEILLLDSEETTNESSSTPSNHHSDKSITRQAPWFPSMREIVAEAIGDECLSTIRDEIDRSKQQPNDKTTTNGFPTTPCGCNSGGDSKIGKMSRGDSENHSRQPWQFELRRAIGLLPKSLVRARKAFMHSRRVDFVAEILNVLMGFEESFGEGLLDEYSSEIAATDEEPVVKNEHEAEEVDEDDGGGPVGLETTAAINHHIRWVRGELRLLTGAKGGTKRIDSVSSFISSSESPGNRWLTSAEEISRDNRRGESSVIACKYDPDQDESSISTIDDEMFTYLNASTEFELKCLLGNRPEFWDKDMKMVDEKMEKHVESIRKLYDL